MSDNTAKRTMTELKAIELAEMPKPQSSNQELTIKLKEVFTWFLGEEFAKLREGFIPTDNSEELKMKKKDELPSISILPEEKTSPNSPIKKEIQGLGFPSYKCTKCDFEDKDPSEVAGHMEKIYH